MTYPEKVQTGDTLYLGSYPQAADGGRLPIEWQVLEVRPERVLVLSRYVLDVQPYHNEQAIVCWDETVCTLRKWLSGEFMDAAFTPEEQEIIFAPDWEHRWRHEGMEGSVYEITDRVFLLSRGDILRYFPAAEDAPQQRGLFCPGASAKFTPYAAQMQQEPSWWLRSYPVYNARANIVSPIDSLGSSAIDAANRLGVRPAMWLSRYPQHICVVEDGVTEIDEPGMASASTTVILPSSAVRIGSYAFCWRRNLKCISFSENLTEIGDHAFFGCDQLDSVLIPKRGADISEWTKLDTLLLPETLTRIGKHAFSDCRSLSSVVIPKGVTSIPDYAFFSCMNLASVLIPNGVTSIGEWAFGCCDKLATLVIPDSVTAIGEQAFCGVGHIVYHGSAQSEDNWGAESWSRE